MPDPGDRQAGLRNVGGQNKFSENSSIIRTDINKSGFNFGKQKNGHLMTVFSTSLSH